MRPTYVAFSQAVLGPFPLEESMRVLRTSGERYGIIVDSQMRVYQFKRPADVLWPTRSDLDRHNRDVNSRMVPSLPEHEQDNPTED